jgi:hypothetical protein
MTDRKSDPPTRQRGDVIVLVVVVGVAAAWAGYNAWAQQPGRTHPLDLDGWGHLILRLQSGGSFGSLFSDPSLWKGPVVPFLFGLCYYVAPFDTSVLVMNAGLFALSAGVLFDAFGRLGAGRWPTAAAVLLWVFYLPHTTVFGYYYAEPFLGFVSAILFWLAGRMIVRPGLGVALATGVTAGILVLARAPFLLVVLGLPLLLWRRLPGNLRLGSLACYGAGCLLTFFPWPLRNYLVEHELIPFTVEGGKILFQGTYLPGDDVGMNEMRQLPEFQKIEAGEEGKSAIEQYHYWRDLAKAQVVADPVGQLALGARKVVRFWVYLPAHSWVPGWKTGVVALLALPLAAVGAWRGRSSPLVQLCLLWVCGLWLFHGLVHAELRYNFPVLPMLFMLALIPLATAQARRHQTGTSDARPTSGTERRG